MKTKNILINSTPEKVFAQIDYFSKTGMHMSENLEQLSTNLTGVGEAKIIIMSWYRMWFEIMPVEKALNN